MNKLLIAVLITILILGAASCKKNPVEPAEEEENLTPGRRDYTWVADTIKNPFLHLYHIWGNSLTNLWTSSTMYSASLFKYDGTKWVLDDRTYLPTPAALWGYEDKLWIGNGNGCIWQFTGSSYQEQLKYHKLGDNFTDFLNMVGSSDKEIYVSGSYRIDKLNYSVLMKYDGNVWKVDKKFDYPFTVLQICYSLRNDRYYITSTNNNGPETVYEYDRTNFKEIFKYHTSNPGPTLAVIDKYAHIVIEDKVYRYRNDKMELITGINDAKFGGIVWGRGRNDIFIRMIDGLAHYNGSDVKYQFKVPESYRMNANMAIFEKDVFISAMDLNSGYNIIYHGKLN